MFHFGFFNPAYGGDPILFQHLFLVLLASGRIHHDSSSHGRDQRIIPTFARKPIFGYDFIAASSIGIAVIGFIVWAHHMFLTGQSTYSAVAFSVPNVPGRGSSRGESFHLDVDALQRVHFVDTPMLYGLGFIGLFTIGGLTGCSRHSRPGHSPA